MISDQAGIHCVLRKNILQYQVSACSVFFSQASDQRSNRNRRRRIQNQIKSNILQICCNGSAINQLDCYRRDSLFEQIGLCDISCFYSEDVNSLFLCQFRRSAVSAFAAAYGVYFMSLPLQCTKQIRIDFFCRNILEISDC